jgi:6-phosphofructokinase 1
MPAYALVRAWRAYDWEPWGVRFGFDGRLHDDFQPLIPVSVHIIELGGTSWVPRAAKSLPARGAARGAAQLNERGIDASCIGGDGSMNGARDLQAAGVPTIGVPGTIENDVFGTDMAIGTDTALNTALEAIDRIKDTASSHRQAFLVEMMGAKSGYLALMAGTPAALRWSASPKCPSTWNR